MRKFFKWLAGLFSSNTVVTVGNGNTTFVSQTTTTVTKIPPLTQEEISQIATKAVENVAAQKIVTNAIAAERKPVKTAPSPSAKPLKAEELKRAVTASRNRASVRPEPARSRAVSDDDSYRRRNDDIAFINTTTISDTYTHHTSSHSSSSHDSYSSCDSSSSFSGSCD
ncbi:hypothetical protein X824_gp033 [Escherichia phage 4MG]|uniref:Hyphothetical protein n=1 Tax=Escherichia phage 4MG TaxID=1391428 RepID=V5KSW0_9CAUD|nr:hypothetical protein X824_gp033 [Escherichia phage 4MG]AGZ17507.1 hyphothetical protein [Escherichia phage 4MG]